ncbi:MAG: hypothetical protein LBJ12_01405 [Oscillospiraceae bacterium]|nr:hypothetical protein [Oscillospiraceae bacterium]
MTDVQLLTLIFGLITIIIGIAGFLVGLKGRAKDSGETRGSFTAELRTDIKYIKDELAEIKSQNLSTEIAILKTEMASMKKDVSALFRLLDELSHRKKGNNHGEL